MLDHVFMFIHYFIDTFFSLDVLSNDLSLNAFLWLRAESPIRRRTTDEKNTFDLRTD